MTLSAELSAKVARLAKLQASIEADSGTLDPVTFARRRFRAFDREKGTRIPFVPDAWQERVLRSRHRRLILLCSRQTGKSTTAAAHAVEHATQTPHALVLLVSPSERQSKELFLKVMAFLRSMRTPPSLIEDNKSSATLANGSRIVSLPCSEETVRGFSAPSLVIFDEAGDVPDELYRAIRPMLITGGGQLILMGTPKGRKGFFFEAWEHGGEQWARVKVTAHDCGRIAMADLEAERQALGPLGFRQEYECEFLNTATGLVYSGWDPARNRIEALPANDNRRPWQYGLGLDFGIVDANGVSLLASRKHDPCDYVVKSYRFQGGPEELGPEVLRVLDQFPAFQIIGDTGGQGKLWERDLASQFRIPMRAADKMNKVGHISLLNAALRTARLKVVGPGCADLIEEWETLPWAVNDQHNDRRQQEAPGYDNHAADSCLYIHHARPTYLEKPEPAPLPVRGTAARFADEEAARLALEDQQKGRRGWERPRGGSQSYRDRISPLASGSRSR